MFQYINNNYFNNQSPLNRNHSHYHQVYSFTLIELMVVLSIIALLAGILWLTLKPQEMINNFKDSQRVQDLQTIFKAIQFMAY